MIPFVPLKLKTKIRKRRLQLFIYLKMNLRVRFRSISRDSVCRLPPKVDTFTDNRNLLFCRDKDLDKDRETIIKFRTPKYASY